jgi:hypothetical protein
VIAEVTSEIGPSPLIFFALTANVYVAPVTRPVTKQLVVVVTHVPGSTSATEMPCAERSADREKTLA